MSTVDRNPDAPIKRAAVMSRDHDVQKGAVEDGYPNITTNAPGLDADGLPNDEMGIEAAALGARVDGAQG